MDVGNLEGYLSRMRTRYRQARRKKDKGEILTELCEVLECHRKSAIRMMNAALTQPRRRPGRPRVYGPLVIEAVRLGWEALDESCGKRLAPQLPVIIDSLERHGEVQLSADVRAQAIQISASTIDRRLKDHRFQVGRRPFTSLQAPSAIKRQVPMRTFGDWAEASPGQVQADLVTHCGVNPAGSFVVTLTVVDVATGWTECRAALTRNKVLVKSALHIIRGQLPFPLTSLHTDNGAEFLNDALLAYCRREEIGFTRGRAYKKNDQAWVEQKNGAVVRRYVGYHRYQDKLAQARLNFLYDWVRLYVNYFQPVRRLIQKDRRGAKVIKRFDTAATPYQRLLASGVLDDATRDNLAREYARLNPVRLRRAIGQAVQEVISAAEPRWGALAEPVRRATKPGAPVRDGATPGEQISVTHL